MKPDHGPSTYAEWLPLLDRFAEGDDSALALMEGGTIEWSQSVTEHFIRQVTAALKRRLEDLSAELQKRLGRAASPLDIRFALSWADRGLAPLSAFSRLAQFHENLRDHLDQECSRWVERTQSSMEASARTGRGDILQMLTASGLRWPPRREMESPGAEQTTTDHSSKRRVLL